MCGALRTAQTHECLPNVFQDALRAARRGQPADVPTPREQKTHIVKAHGQILKHAEKEMDATRKNDIERGSCHLHAVVGQQMEITSSIHRKCEDSQLEMGQTSNCRHERTHGSSRKLSDVSAKYWGVEPSATFVLCHSETPRHVQQQKRSRIFPQCLFVSIPQRTTTRGNAKTADVIPFFSTKDDSNKLPLKTTAS